MAEQKRAIALGFFDGVHIGHAALLNKAKERAEENGMLPSVLSFDTHPDYLITGNPVPLINSPKDRAVILDKQFGITDTVFLHFNKNLMCMPWEEFLDSFVNEMNIGWIVAGHDFTFGFKGQGNRYRLAEYCEARGIGCDIIEPVLMDGKIISSTYIRYLLSEGLQEEANRFLGHPHILTGHVKSGYRLGTKMGTPTINLFFHEGVLVPRHGVYAAFVTVDGVRYHAVTNIGVRPTVSDSDHVSVESFLLNFSGNLYGKKVSVEFMKFMRGEVRFADVDELAHQIKADAEAAETYLSAMERENKA